jgi:hypothetical protein
MRNVVFVWLIVGAPFEADFVHKTFTQLIEFDFSLTQNEIYFVKINITHHITNHYNIKGMQSIKIFWIRSFEINFPAKSCH